MDIDLGAPPVSAGSTARTDFLPARVHLLGAGGAGVSGLGALLAARGHRVTAHDRADSAMFAGLRRVSVEPVIGPSTAASLPSDAQAVIRSVAVPAGDPQVTAALARGLPVWKYGEALGRLAPPARTLGVAGTHGKTSTSWLLWHALETVGEERNDPIPGALIGGVSRRFDAGAMAGNEGGWFCVEACEYDRTFLNLSPFGAVVTNVEAEHLDYYGSLPAIEKAFARYLDRVDAHGLIVLGREVPEEVELGARAEVWRLGRELEVDLLGEERGRFRFRLRGPGWASPPVRLVVPGHFNVENAALAMALAVGLSCRGSGDDPALLAAAAARGVERFEGVRRRFEVWGADERFEVVHDYAHHPTEVRVTLEAARRVFPGRPLHVLFQPHQHSRTHRFLGEFAESLRGVDRVVVSDVYGARLHTDGERTAGARELVLELRALGVDALEGGSLGGAVATLVDGLPDRAAVLVLGAGDVESCRAGLLAQLALPPEG